MGKRLVIDGVNIQDREAVRFFPQRLEEEDVQVIVYTSSIDSESSSLNVSTSLIASARADPIPRAGS